MNEVSPNSVVRTTWGIIRVVVAILLVAGVATQAQATYTNAVAHARDVTLVMQNFFLFFTMLANLFATVVLVLGGLWLLTRGRKTQWEPAWLSYCFVASSTYVIITGVVYNALLRSIPVLEPNSVPWANETLHTVAPIVMFLELFVLAFARRWMSWKAVWIAMIPPILWLALSLIRGGVTPDAETGAPTWYPYPFLDPNIQGWGGVWLYIVGIAAVVALIAALGTWRTHTKSRRIA